MSARIVIVDRAANDRIMWRATLARAAFDVVLCGDLAELALALAARPADIVLADGSDLGELAALLRARAGLAAGAAVIALARAGDARARTAALQAGADDVLDRDSGEALVLSTLRRHLRRRNASRDIALGPLPDPVPDALPLHGMAEAQAAFAVPAMAGELPGDAAGGIAIISARPLALPRAIRMLIERHPGPVMVQPAPAMVDGQAALYVVDGGSWPVSSGVSPGLYGAVAELEVMAKAQHAATLVLVPVGADHLGAMALDLGAEDQAAEDVSAEELSHRVRRLLRRMAAEQRQRDRLQTTIAAANLDPLTGLANRRHAIARLESMAAAARDRAEPLAVMMLDIDHFKRINDTYGHAVGDACLAAVAERLRGALRRNDIVGRIGGEEFCIFLPGATEDEARATGERLCRATAFAPDGEDVILRVTLSAGASLARATVPLDTLMVQADRALYRAKAEGRARLVLWSEQGALPG